MKKTFFFIILFAVLIFSCACGSEQTEFIKPQTLENSAADEPAETPETSETWIMTAQESTPSPTVRTTPETVAPDVSDTIEISETTESPETSETSEMTTAMPTTTPAVTSQTTTPAVTTAQTVASSSTYVQIAPPIGYLPINWENPDIEKAVSEYLNKSAEDITREDLNSVRSVMIEKLNMGSGSYELYFLINFYTAENKGETEYIFPYYTPINARDGKLNLKDISNFKALKTLEVYNCEIADMKFVSELTGLVRIVASNVSVNDLSALKNLTSLQYLEMDGNGITDMSPLKNLTYLKYLSLGDNNITDISALKNLAGLEYLDLSYNLITDISPLKKLERLTDLYLCANQISDVSPLKNLKNLRSTDLEDNIAD